LKERDAKQDAGSTKNDRESVWEKKKPGGGRCLVKKVAGEKKENAAAKNKSNESNTTKLDEMGGFFRGEKKNHALE